MGIRGTKPTPTAIKKKRGTLRKSRTNAAEPSFPALSPHAPLGVPAPVAQFYADYAQALVDAGVLTAADHAIFRRLAEANWIATVAAKKLEHEPFTRMDENKIERKSPWLQIWRDASLVMAKLSAEFGMTPSARSRVAGIPQPEKSLAELLFEGTHDATQA